ncbi:LTA synthase family protein [Paenibacillus sp. JX-17]|uniref:LTA synthase family protein n=1 Tax=Paenibacillus lacisoli TaxID=3064525 RepID=A0ABT9CAW2_9BACL|nr:LTA synthase family protein [Paenibacillus sp. JX-17]MDO7906394.1 LTA synthase family protein [Paenibacillus sp. JX-17]
MSRDQIKTFVSIPFVWFTLLLLLKSYLAWSVLFDGSSPWKPLLTEIPWIWLFFCLIEWLAGRRRMIYYMILNLLLTGIFFAAIMYYKYYGVIVTYHALAQVNQATAVKSSMFSLLDPYYLFIFTDIVVIAGMCFSRRQRSRLMNLPAAKSRRWSMPVLLGISLTVCLFNVWPNRASMNELTQASHMGILGYEAYTMLADDNPAPVPAAQITQQAIHTLKQIPSQDSNAYTALAKGRNVVVIQLESFQNFLLGLKIDGKEITPNLNALAKQSLYFPNFYQQVGQGNTSDAEFVVNTSFYIPPDGAATQVYAHKELPSLPKLLAANGYQTATFHTNKVTFWNRDQLYKAVGFGHVYDSSYFGTEDPVAFGASDEVLYAKTAQKMSELSKSGQPFYAQIISMSAHHPYHLPERKYKMTLPGRYEDTLVGDYIRSQNYADQALGLFIKDLKNRGLWDQSLIVVYGDHLGLPIYSLNGKDRELMKEIYGRDYTNADMINIPLLAAVPGAVKPLEVVQTGGQVDVLPTIANLVGIPLDGQIHFGQDLLSGFSNLLPQRYYLPSGSLLNSSALFIPGDGFEDGLQQPLYAFTSGDASVQAVMSGTGADDEETGQEAAIPAPRTADPQSSVSESDYERALRLLHLSDSYVSQLPERKR